MDYPEILRFAAKFNIPQKNIEINGASKIKVNLKELKKAKEQNRKERFEFVRLYANWVKRTPNKVWSRQLAKMLDG